MFESVELWAQFGLAGLVIFALFFLLYQGVKIVTAKFEAINKANNEVIHEITSLHANERKEWRNEISKHNDKLADALDGLSKNVQEQTIAIRLNSGGSTP